MSEQWNVQNFLNQLKSAQPQPRSNEPKGPVLEKTYLSFTENLGRYQIFPVISTVTGMPFEYLYRTREICVVSDQKNQDGSDRKSWHRLLPLSAYDFIDSTGRRVSALTQAEQDLLQSAYGVFDRMWEVVPEAMRKDICRLKNYTVGNAYVINKYGLKDNNKPARSGFSTLLVCTSKDFANAINKDIEMQMINHGNDASWLGEIYNRLPKGRTGWLIFSISVAPNGIGYSVNASHTSSLSPAAVEGLEISPEDMELMQDPIRTFLGWQAGPEGKLFNEPLITSTIEEMNKIIAKFSNSAAYANPMMAAAATQSTAQAAAYQPAPTMDPMMASMAAQNVAPQQTMVQTPAQMAQANDNPFVNPPAAQFDPMAGVPNNYGQQPSGYQQPSFAQQASAPVENPFLNANPNGYRQ